MKDLANQMGEAMALRVDAEIWWFALKEHYRKYADEVYWQKYVENTKPWWLPMEMWLKIHNSA